MRAGGPVTLDAVRHRVWLRTPPGEAAEVDAIHDDDRGQAWPPACGPRIGQRRGAPWADPPRASARTGEDEVDQLVVEVTEGPAVTVGDEVVLIGRQGDEEITADEWAGLLDTISYEIVCGFGPRLPRRHLTRVSHGRGVEG